MTDWIRHVKAYAAKHKCSYGEALKRASSSYKKKAQTRAKFLAANKRMFLAGGTLSPDEVDKLIEWKREFDEYKKYQPALIGRHEHQVYDRIVNLIKRVQRGELAHNVRDEDEYDRLEAEYDIISYKMAENPQSV